MSISLDDIKVQLDEHAATLKEMSRLLKSLVEKNSIKEYYTAKEFAKINNLTANYVRELCHDRRLNHKKTQSGRGNKKEIRISHDELLRYQSQGLLRK